MNFNILSPECSYALGFPMPPLATAPILAPEATEAAVKNKGGRPRKGLTKQDILIAQYCVNALNACAVALAEKGTALRIGNYLRFPIEKPPPGTIAKVKQAAAKK